MRRRHGLPDRVLQISIGIDCIKGGTAHGTLDGACANVRKRAGFGEPRRYVGGDGHAVPFMLPQGARRWLQNPTFWRFARKRWTKDNVASSLRQHSTALKRYILQRGNDGSVLPIETENGCGRGCVLAVVSLMDCDKNPVRFWVAIATRRGEKVRIISVRKATRKEVAFYDREVYRIGV